MAYNIQDYRDYLRIAVKYGYLDADQAQDLEDRKAWDEVEKMMLEGDYDLNVANENTI
jgi:hypothetical protein